MKRKIALIFYYLKENRYSINALAGFLEKDSYFDQLEIFFLKKESELFDKLPEILENYEETILGISFATTQLFDIAVLIRKLKSLDYKRILYIAGGPHPSGDALGTLKLGFDIAVLNEGEETLQEILKKIDQDESLEEVRGIAFLDGNQKFNYTGRRDWMELDYIPVSTRYNKFGPVEITRGCPFVCGFCQNALILGTRPRHRSVEIVCQYVNIMKERNLNDFRVITPNAFSYGSIDGREINLDAMYDLLSNVRKILGKDGRIFYGSFPSEVRPEHVTEETLKLFLQFADNDNLIIGAQSGSPKILEICRRGHTVEDIYSAVEKVLGVGLKANVDFIFGLPGETDDDVNLTLKTIKDFSKMGARIHAHTFMPLPQTLFAKSPPGRINKFLRKELNRLTSRGIIYGEWVRQEKIARKIFNYLKYG